MYYRIDAADTWFFRGPVPFDAGTEHSADSMFPPLPSVYAGALGSCASPTPRLPGRQEGGSKSGSLARQMRLGWNGVTADGHFLFPVPRDLYAESDKVLSERLLFPADDSSSALPYFLAREPMKNPEAPKKETVLSGGGVLSDSDLGTYLGGFGQPLPCVALGDYMREETRIGIQMDRQSGKAADEHLYQRKAIRPVRDRVHGCSLAVDVSGVDVPEGAAFRFGGESGLGIIHRMDAAPAIPPAPELFRGKYFKLYFTTPAIFANGWLPGWIDEAKLTGSFAYKGRRVRVKLIGAAVGRPIAAGSFVIPEKTDANDPARRPREMRYAVPAGSVYFFRLTDGHPEDVGRLFHKRCLSEYRAGFGFRYENWDRMRYCDRGYGYCLVGKISEKQGENLYV